jgi:hypothetical protein
MEVQFEPSTPVHKSVDEIEALADDLTPGMRHALLRCSDAAFGEELAPRCWWDVIAHRPHTSFRATIDPLARRGLVKLISYRGAAGTFVALTNDGLRVQAALRLRGGH